MAAVRRPSAAAFGLATAGALIVQGAALRFVRAGKKEDAANRESAASSVVGSS